MKTEVNDIGLEILQDYMNDSLPWKNYIKFIYCKYK